MADTTESDGRSADTTFGYSQFELDPDYLGSTAKELSRVWLLSEILRVLLEKRGHPTGRDREQLKNEVIRQLPTLMLYRRAIEAKRNRYTGRGLLTLYALLFPGEGKDNTGIKDLNDILGYERNNEFIRRRQCHIAQIFDPVEPLGDKYFTVVGQDYKTASILTVGRTREEFAEGLKRLDDALREELIVLLKDAEADETPEGRKQRPAVQKLLRILERSKKSNKTYRFDFLFGLADVVLDDKRTPLLSTLLLVTEALKGAGVARYIAKAENVGGTARKYLVKIPADSKKVDPRGKQFDVATYLKAATMADVVKKRMTTPYHRDDPLDFVNILVNTVWITAFLLNRRLYVGNPDVIRDARKKALKPPTAKEGTKYTFSAQVDLLEQWLVTLNMMDLIKDFLSTELNLLQRYHADTLAAFNELLDESKTIDWSRLERVLTHDLRQEHDRVCVMGRASEFLFYSYASDFTDRIFLSMDVRDMGVDVLILYEGYNEIIIDHQLKDEKLMQTTLFSSDLIVRQRRVTYDVVVKTFRDHYKKLLGGKGKPAAFEAFGHGIGPLGRLPDFDKTAQFMLGGDEIFVAADPRYTELIPDIIDALDGATFENKPLNLRTAVTFSSAQRVSDPAAQKRKNQEAHDQAIQLAGNGPGPLKDLERRHRRIEMLIDKLEANPKKKHLAPGFTQQLTDLHLTKVYAEIKRGHAKRLDDRKFAQLRRLLRQGTVAQADESIYVAFVDFLTGKRISGDKLTRDAADLEKKVRDAVGWDNRHVDGPPATKMPRIIRWLEEINKQPWPPRAKS
jgi:hypothetical protein